MKTLIIGHGDGDGIISIAVIQAEITVPNREIQVAITQPFLLDKVAVDDDVNEIFVVDIAVNNKNPQMTIDFVEKYKNRIVLWADHHAGTENLEAVLKGRLIYADEPSCPALLSKHCLVSQSCIDAANACDRPTDYPPTELSERYNRAFKVALVELQDGDRTIVEKIQKAFIEELLSGEESQLISDYGNRYESIILATKKAADSFVELTSGVGITALEEEKVDKTLLCTEGYKKFPVVVIQFTDTTNEPATIVATNRKDLNLVQTFGLPSGAPFRIILSGDHQTVAKVVAAKFK